jgi:D-inositol-3-phosphate glycosyltransferase
MRIAMVSEHASPLAVLGGQDAGGQNVHVAALSTALGRRGHDVRVYTRRDDPGLPERQPFAPGVEVVHVPAGPATALPKDELLPHMPAMADWLAQEWARWRPDVAHAHFWMSGLATSSAARRLPRPPRVAVTFHALGVVKRRHQGDQDTSPAERIGIERTLVHEADAVVATCRDEVAELLELGAEPERVHVVPCGVDLDRFTPDGPCSAPWTPGAWRLLSIGRLVPRKGVETMIEALADLPEAELVVAGGDPPSARPSPDARRLEAAARAAGVSDRVHLVGQVEPAGAAACRSRRWLAAHRSWPVRSAACSTRCGPGPPAGTCRPATPQRWRSPSATR